MIATGRDFLCDNDSTNWLASWLGKGDAERKDGNKRDFSFGKHVSRFFLKLNDRD